MTVIVGIAEEGSVLLGCDSAGASPQQTEIYSIKNTKIFKAGPYALGFTTSYRLGQILRYETELPAPPPQENLDRFMATAFVESIRRTLETHSFSRGLGDHGSILVGVHGQLFTVGAEFQVLSEATSYAVVGSGRHAAYGALFALEGSKNTLRQKVEIALQAAQNFTTTVREPFHFITTA